MNYTDASTYTYFTNAEASVVGLFYSMVGMSLVIHSHDGHIKGHTIPADLTGDDWCEVTVDNSQGFVIYTCTDHVAGNVGKPSPSLKLAYDLATAVSDVAGTPTFFEQDLVRRINYLRLHSLGSTKGSAALKALRRHIEDLIKEAHQAGRMEVIREHNDKLMNQLDKGIDPLSNFQEGQWWVDELDRMAAAATELDQKRAVAVVHHMLRSASATIGADKTKFTQGLAEQGLICKSVGDDGKPLTRQEYFSQFGIDYEKEADALANSKGDKDEPAR
jgi:hypothetical protein